MGGVERKITNITVGDDQVATIHLTISSTRDGFFKFYYLVVVHHSLAFCFLDHDLYVISCLWHR